MKSKRLILLLTMLIGALGVSWAEDNLYVYGNWTGGSDWSDTELKWYQNATEGKLYSCTIDLTAGTAYQFKFRNTSSDTYWGCTTSALTMPMSSWYEAKTDGNNIEFTPTANGTYTFRFNSTTHYFVVERTTLKVPASTTYKLSEVGKDYTSIMIESGGTLEADINETYTLTPVISGDGAVVVSAGIVTFGADNTFSGGLAVKSGAIIKNTSSKSGFGKNEASVTLANLNLVTVESGGAVDLSNTNGQSYRYAIAGTGVNNSGALYSNTAIGNASRQCPSITLTADATISCAANWGILGADYGLTSLNLAGHTLTKTGSASFIMCNINDDDTAGKIVVTEGNLWTTQKGSILSTYEVECTGNNGIVADANVSFKKITLSSDKTLTLNGSTVTVSEIAGAGTITLTNAIPQSYPSTNTNWTGTVVFPEMSADQSNLTAKCNAWGNTGSTINLNSITGYFNESETVNPTLNLLEGSTVTINNGSSNKTPVITKLAGVGNLIITCNPTTTFSIKDASTYTGTCTVNNANATVTVTGNLGASTWTKTNGTLKYLGASLSGTTLDGVILAGSSRITVANAVTINNLAGNDLTAGSNNYAFVGSGTLNFGGTNNLHKKSDGTTGTNFSKIGLTSGSTINVTSGKLTSSVLRNTDDPATNNGNLTVASGAEVLLTSKDSVNYIPTLTNNGTVTIRGGLNTSTGVTANSGSSLTISKTVTGKINGSGTVTIASTDGLTANAKAGDTDGLGIKIYIVMTDATGTLASVQYNSEAKTLTNGAFDLNETSDIYYVASTINTNNVDLSNHSVQVQNGAILNVDKDLTLASGKKITAASGARINISEGKILDATAQGWDMTTVRGLIAAASGGGTLKFNQGDSGNPELHNSNCTSALTFNTNVEFTGKTNLILVGTYNQTNDVITVSAGKTVKISNATLWNKRNILNIDGTVDAKTVEIGHQESGTYPGTITIKNGGTLSTESIKFMNYGGNTKSALTVEDGGTLGITQNSSAAFFAVDNATYAITLNGNLNIPDAVSLGLPVTSTSLNVVLDAAAKSAIQSALETAVAAGNDYTLITGAENSSLGTVTVGSCPYVTVGNDSYTIKVSGNNVTLATGPFSSKKRYMLKADGTNPALYFWLDETAGKNGSENALNAAKFEYGGTAFTIQRTEAGLYTFTAPSGASINAGPSGKEWNFSNTPASSTNTLWNVTPVANVANGYTIQRQNETSTYVGADTKDVDKNLFTNKSSADTWIVVEVTSVSGTVKCGETPLESATVTLTNSAEPNATYSATTNVDGEYTVYVLNGTYTGTITKDLYTDATIASFEVSGTTFGQNVTMEKAPYFSLAVSVTGATEAVNTRAGMVTITRDGKTTYDYMKANQSPKDFAVTDFSTLALSMYGNYRGYTFDGFTVGSNTNKVQTINAGDITSSGTTVTAHFTASTDNGQNLWYDFDCDKLSNTGNMGIPARIPAMTQLANGDILAFSDYRPGEKDLGESQTSVQVRKWDHSTGVWGDTLTIARGLGDKKTSFFDFSFGDAAVVSDHTSGNTGNDVICIVGAGNAKFSDSNKSNANHQVTAFMKSTDGGKTWSYPIDMTLEANQNIYSILPSTITKIFFSSGNILQSAKKKTGASYNRIYSALVTNDGNYVVYSDDWGTSWSLLGDVNGTNSGRAIEAGDEAHVEEMADGTIVVCSRSTSHNNRMFNVYTFSENGFDAGSGTWADAQIQTGSSFQGTTCHGDFQIITAYKSDGNTTTLALVSCPTSSSPRKDVKINYKEITKTSGFAPSDFQDGWSQYQVSNSTNTKVSYQSAYSTMVPLESKKIAMLYEETFENRDDHVYISVGRNSHGYNEVYREFTIEQLTGNTYYTSNPTVAGTYNYTLTDQCGNTYTGQLTNTTLANVPTALKTAYPIISEVGSNMSVEQTAEGVYSYSNTITLPFKVSNASNTYWQNIYFPSNTNENCYPVYWKGEENATLPTTATESLAYGASTYNTKDNANKVSWAIYNSGNQFKFTFKNQLTGMYLYVADGTTPYDGTNGTLANVSLVDGITTAATAFDILKNTSYAGDYAISFNDYYLCSWSASNGTLTCGTDKTHNGAYVKFVDAPDFTTLIASANTNLGCFNDKIGYYASDNEAATAAKAAMQNSDNVTLNNLTAYAALTGTVVLPSTDKYYRLKGSVSGKYAYSQGSGKQMKMSATESDYKTAGLFLFDGDTTNGFTLLNYKDGLYVYDTHSVGSTSSEVSTFTFAAPTTAHVGTLTIKQVEDISSHGHWMYDNGNQSTPVVDRNSSYASQNCDWILEEVTVDLPVYKKEGSTDEAPVIEGTITNANQILALTESGARSVDLTGATIDSNVTINKTFMTGLKEDTYYTTSSSNYVVNDNIILYVPSGTTLGTGDDAPDNVIVKGDGDTYSCSSFVLTDQKQLAVPTAFSADKITYQRETTTEGETSVTKLGVGKYATIYVPYVFNPGDFKVMEFDNYKNGIVNFKYVTEIQPNTPYIIRPNNGTEEDLVFNLASSTTVSTTPDAATESDARFYGTYETKTLNGTYGYYGFSATTGTFKLANKTSGTSIQPFRAYFWDGTTTPSARAASLGFTENGGEATAIESVLNAMQNGESLYDLNGHRVIMPENGKVYIMGGKKVMFK